MPVARMIRRAITSWTLYRARRRTERACPEIAAVPLDRQARDRLGRWKSTKLARRKAIHDRLAREVARQWQALPASAPPAPPA